MKEFLSANCENIYTKLVNNFYSCSNDILEILKNPTIRKIFDKIPEGNIHLCNPNYFENKIISKKEKYIENLDKYISFIKDNYFINHVEQIKIIELSVVNKYNDILLSEKSLYGNENVNNYIEGFKRMFMYNIYTNLMYLTDKNYQSNNSTYFRADICRYNFDSSDINKIDIIIGDIINNTNNGLYHLFEPMKFSSKIFYEEDMKLVDNILEKYYSKRKTRCNFGIYEGDNYMETKDGDIVVFNIYNNYYRSKGDRAYVEFGIKNNYFSAKSEGYLLTDAELSLLLNKIKNINKKKNYEEDINFINTTLSFKIGCDDNFTYLDIIFRYEDNKDKFFVLQINGDDIKKIKKIIESQISNI